MHRSYNIRPIPGKSPTRQSLQAAWLAVVIVIIAVIYSAWALLRPLGQLHVVMLPPVIPAQVKVNIPWPAQGQAAFGADNYGLLSMNGQQKPTPTASVAKIVTALAILSKKPLHVGETGPPITITASDVALYQQYIAKDGAVVPVYEGQTITEYQALEAMMLPSANNMADTAAIWAFGSLPAYTAYANDFVKKLGLTQTTISDASGFSPQTVSTAGDLVKLGDAALDNPVLASIVAMKTAEFPGYGTISNVNSLLGTAGIRGIKTGNTDEAGGVYLAAADVAIDDHKITVITAVMNAPNLSQAMKNSVPIIQAAVSEFQTVHVVRAGQNVGTVTAPWGARSDIIADKDISAFVWSGTSLAPSAHANSLKMPVNAGASAGTLSLTYNGTTVSSSTHVKDSISGPTFWWRLRHPI